MRGTTTDRTVRRRNIPRVVFAAMAVCLVLAGCARAPEIVGIDNAQTPVASVAGAQKIHVFMATTRAATEVTGAFFSADRAPDLSLTSVTVSIPPGHKTGKIERPSHLPPDPTTEFAIVEPTIYDGERSFVAALNRELASRRQDQRDVLFFVHGYNSTTTDALLRIAQFTADTNFNGVPVLFSWASAGKVTRYVYDINSALVARRALLDSARIVLRSNTSGINVFAHSMGAFLTVEAIVQAELFGAYNPAGRLQNVMLAAPDIDVDLFRSQMQYLEADARNFFVFVSRDDRILDASRRLSGGIDRVGSASAAELAGLGVTVIDLSEVDATEGSVHSKFAGSPEVVALIGGSLTRQNLHREPRSPSLVEVLNGVPVLREFTPK